MRSIRNRRYLAALLVSASFGVAGCATQQPWDLPDPYAHGASRSSPYYGSGAYGYGAGYGYRYGDPYPYYRAGVPVRYPGYSYYGYPYVPRNYCRDANRDGRCDDRRVDDGANAPGPGANQPPRDVRRMLERERARRATPGAQPRPAPVDAAPAPRPAGAAPTVRGIRTPPRPQPRVEPRQRSQPATLSQPPRSVPRVEPASRAVDEGARGRRPLR